ncbi:MAG: hypothetical protein AAGA56_20355 [Myxococcota bacterium]
MLTSHLLREVLAPLAFIVTSDVRRRYVLAETLRAQGIVVASDAGHEAMFGLFAANLTGPATWVSLVAALHPDVVVVDLDGADEAVVTVGALREHPLTTALPVVVFGGSDADLRSVLRLGAVHAEERPSVLSGVGDVVFELFASSAGVRTSALSY